MHNYLNELNPAQKQAVINFNGPSLILASAGSGKTRVLTYRIAHLMANGINASNILALTFTNKAAKEMRNRIADIVGNEIANYLWMGTFHSIFAKILRFEAESIGYKSNFSIYDTADSKNLIKTIIKDFKLDVKQYKVGMVLGRISRAKNNLITASAYKQNTQLVNSDYAQRIPLISDIYTEYVKRCKIADAMDFDDLLLNTNILFHVNKQALEKYQDKFKYILVDEYQDTNSAQYLIIKQLAKKHNNVCVVGDDAQSIYSFRGAKIENIFNLKKDYPQLATYKLEHNYRSTKTIVNAANSVIEKNVNQLKKEAYTDNDEGDKITLFKAITEIEEGYLIANSIAEYKIQNQAHYNDFAILYRTNAQSRILEEALRKLNIPYRIYGGLSFYQRKEIKDLISYLRIVINPSDNESLKRVINYPARGIGATTMNKIENAANNNGVPIWMVINMPQNYDLKLNKGTIQKIQGFTALIKQFNEVVKNSDAYDAAMYIASNTGLLKDLHNDKSIEGLSRYENIQELLNSLKDFVAEQFEQGNKVGLEEYIQNVALLTDADSKDEDIAQVTLMTIHAAKGLEFPYVYIAGLEEKLFPSEMAMQNSSEIEEERRLFYVAITRAQKKATISYCQSRYKWGNIEEKKPSRFIREIDQQYLDKSIDELTNSKYFKSKNITNTNKTNRIGSKRPLTPNKGASTMINRIKTDPISNFEADSPEQIKQGQTVMHQRFGRGKVLRIDGAEKNKKAIVQFSIGTKNLLLRFAKLKIIDN